MLPRPIKRGGQLVRDTVEILYSSFSPLVLDVLASLKQGSRVSYAYGGV